MHNSLTAYLLLLLDRASAEVFCAKLELTLLWMSTLDSQKTSLKLSFWLLRLFNNTRHSKDPHQRLVPLSPSFQSQVFHRRILPYHFVIKPDLNKDVLASLAWPSELQLHFCWTWKSATKIGHMQPFWLVIVANVPYDITNGTILLKCPVKQRQRDSESACTIPTII